MATYSKIICGCFVIVALGTGCSTAKHFFAVGNDDKEVKPIESPFGNFDQTKPPSENMTWRSKNGDRSVEVEIPNQANTDFDIPMNGKFMHSPDQTAEGVDYRYQTVKPTMTDREIASTFSKSGNPQDEMNRNEIENSMGLHKSDEPPNMDESFLAKMDIVKQLFVAGRHEAALLELDKMIRIYPTNARLYEMRGTVLDRLGYTDMAIRSWKQAYEFEPNKVALKKMIERREQQRSIASERK